MSNLPDPIDRRHFRAADSDREKIASLLREAAGDGRLSLDELDDRLAALYEARTYAELQSLVADLPYEELSTRARQRAFDEIALGKIPKLAVAFLSGFKKQGAWSIPGNFTAITFMGGGQIDLREARFTEGEVTIRVFAMMGGVQITVPSDADLVVDGFAVMGGFGHREGSQQYRGPRIRITGFALMGGVEVRRRDRREGRQGPKSTS
ncbi:DUF1707 SHOCT-like domain-containing protein [Phytomonospora endophytica]|uniref:Cell wall-active antibiotics response LiaF-like C-terminal domain-containing protein n=1 Tax=Phytomonospora endophytica TaxID=714109 RepID=A0A841F7S4_9ACTN|nr:DUF1707 domain-containing protein [Phytomonospora endophytica]MBB6033091.1 hypothetical protein [Phytomonospora endophytica]GIG65318.1 hypothetical protein Pen01_16130 [Phytomonospora endophytica]